MIVGEGYTWGKQLVAPLPTWSLFGCVFRDYLFGLLRREAKGFFHLSSFEGVRNLHTHPSALDRRKPAPLRNHDELLFVGIYRGVVVRYGFCPSTYLSPPAAFCPTARFWACRSPVPSFRVDFGRPVFFLQDGRVSGNA